MFSDNYISLCAKSGDDPTALAERLGFSRAAGSKWCNGSLPRKKTLQILADYFGITVEELVKDNKKNAPTNESGYKDMIMNLFGDSLENLQRVQDALAKDPEKTKAKFALFLETL